MISEAPGAKVAQATLATEADPRPVLLAHHADDLKRSGLSDETIRRARAYSESDPGRVAALLNWRGGAEALGPCLVIPHLDATGEQTSYYTIKPDRPLTEGNGKGRTRKYECPKGQPTRPYFPPGTLAGLADPSVPLLVTEGVKKGLAADQAGLPCIALAGVYGFMVKRPKGADGKSTGPRVLIDDLAAVAWKGRKVTIIYDSDAATNKNVLWGEWHLAQTLRSVGATVHVVRLPGGPGNAKQGLDDYLVAHGADALKQLVANAKPPVRPLSDEPHDDPSNPHRLATGFVNALPANQPVRFHRGEFLQYEAGAYRARPEADLRAELTNWVRQEFVRLNVREVQDWEADPSEKKGKRPEVRRVTVKLIGDVCQALRGALILSASIEPPSWINGAGGPDPAGILPVKNGLLVIDRAAARQPNALLPHTPHLFATIAAPFGYHPDAPEPEEWLKFLESVWGTDRESIDALQEWFGYLLALDTRLQKILLLIGPRRSGKGTIAGVLRALIGEQNYAGPTLGSLGTDFGLQQLIGKPVAVVSDARLSGRTDSSVVVERLLTVSGEDAVTIPRKFKESITTKLPTRFVVMTNEVPRFTDSSNALAGRFIVLRMSKSWFTQEDPRLLGRLKAELPSILIWSLAGWARLNERGKFLQPASATDLIESLEEIGSPVSSFVKERCRLRPSLHVGKLDLYSAWCQWCEEKGRTQPGTEPMFGRDLRAACETVGEARLRITGGRLGVYTGIGLDPYGYSAGAADGHGDHGDRDDFGDDDVQTGHRGHPSGHPDGHPEHAWND